MSDTKPDLDAIEARAKAATPGPWHEGLGWVYTEPFRDDDNRLANIFGMPWADEARQVEEGARAARNVEFVAHAREDVPALVAYARTLEAEVEEWADTANIRMGMLRSARRRAEAAEAERDRARATAVHLEQELAQRLDQIRAAARAVVTAWDESEAFEPCGDCLRSGVGIITADSDTRMDATTDDLRRVLDGDQRTETP